MTCPRCRHPLTRLDAEESFCLACGHRHYAPVIVRELTAEDRALFGRNTGRPKTIRTRPCPTCGRDFEPKDRDQRYCSISCGARRPSRERTAEIVCASCGVTFVVPWRGRERRFCSKACSNKGQRRRDPWKAQRACRPKAEVRV